VNAPAAQPAQPGPPGGRGGFGPQGPIELKPDWDKFSVYFNIDNGTGALRGIYLQGNDAAAPIFREWMEPFRSLGMTTITVRNTGGTDHQSFDAVGLPGFQFIQDEVEYDTMTHHTNLDSYERLQPSDMMKNATIAASFADACAAQIGRVFTQPDSEDDSAWVPNHLEYQFSTAAQGTGQDTPPVLRADQYCDGHLDWHAFDAVVERPPAPVPTAYPRA